MKLFGAAVSAVLSAVPMIAAADGPASATLGSPAEAPVEISQLANPAAAGQAIAEQITVTGQFQGQTGNSATKLDVPSRDVPYSVETYTGSFMRAIETEQVSDLYRYMTGLQRAGETSYDTTVRGFSTSASDRNAIMVDGLPGLAVRFGSPPTVGTDHIELVKGPASLLYGESQPGGFINIISKTPQDTPYTILTGRGIDGAIGGTERAKGYDAALDSTGPVPGTDDRLLYRLIVEKGYDTSFQDFSFDDAFYIAPMLTWKLDEATTATVQLEFRSTKTNYMNTQLIVPMGATNLSGIAPLTTNYTNPSGYQTESGETATLRVSHRFDNDFTWNFAYRDVQHRDASHAFDVTGIDAKDPTRLDLRARGQLNIRTYDFADTNLTMPFETLGIGHRAIVGLDLGREVDDFNRTQYCALNTLSSTKVDPSCNIGSKVFTISLTNPSYAGIPGLGSFGIGKVGTGGSARNHTYTSNLAEGVYGSDYVTLTEHWKLEAGVRYAWEKQENNADLLETVPTTSNTATDVLPQGGIVYQPTENLSFYASESTSFTPVPANTRGTIGVTSFQPTTGEGFEAGVKAQFMGGRIDVTAAYFHIDQHNILTPFSGSDPTICPTGTTCQLQIGAARSEGEELEASARPIEGLTMIAGYAHTDARVTGSTANGPLVGSPLPNSPVDAAHLWARYDFAEGSLDGFGVGLGYSYVGDRKPFSPTAKNPIAVTLPAYQVADLGLYYALPHDTELTFKVSNLLGERYYESGSTQNNYINIQPGVPRTMSLTLRTAF